MGFVMKRGEELSRDFTVSDQDFDINFGRTAVGRDFMLLLGGLNVKQVVQHEILVQIHHFLHDRGRPR